MLFIYAQVQLSSGDLVNSYAGLRTIELTKKEDQQIIILNGQPLDFQVEIISICTDQILRLDSFSSFHDLKADTFLRYFVHFWTYGINESLENVGSMDHVQCSQSIERQQQDELVKKKSPSKTINKIFEKVGPLDQGYWPDGLLTPPSEEAIRQNWSCCWWKATEKLEKIVSFLGRKKIEGGT